MTCIAPILRAAELDRIEAVAQAQRDGRTEHLQLSPGGFRFSHRMADLGPLRIQSNSVAGSYLARGQPHAGVWALIYPNGEAREASRVNGIRLGIRDAMLLAPGAEIHSRVADGQSWTMAVLDGERFRDAFERLPLARHGRAVPLPGLLARAPGLLRLAELPRGGLAGGDGARPGVAVSEAIVDGLHAELDGAFAAGGPARRLRSDGRVMRVAAAAREYLHAAGGRPVYSEEIGAAVGVSPRFVNHCFDAIYGVSVHRYLRLHRLAQARRRLLAGEPGVLVKQVALDLGLWHFGRFARAYAELFGETPSQTLVGAGRREAGAVAGGLA